MVYTRLSHQTPRGKMASTKKSKEEAKKKKQSSKESAKSLSKKTPTKSKTKAISNGKKGELAVSVVSPSGSDSGDVIVLDDEGETKSGGGKNRRPSGEKSSSNGIIKGKLKTKVGEDNDLVGGEEEENDGTTCRFPMARIKRIIHSEDPDSKLSQDAVFLVNKATDKFIEQFCEEAYKCSVHDRKKSLGYKHLAMVVSKRRRFDFLSDYVPEKLKAVDALAERKLAGTGQG